MTTRPSSSPCDARLPPGQTSARLLRHLWCTCGSEVRIWEPELELVLGHGCDNLSRTTPHTPDSAWMPEECEHRLFTPRASTDTLDWDRTDCPRSIARGTSCRFLHPAAAYRRLRLPRGVDHAVLDRSPDAGCACTLAITRAYTYQVCVVQCAHARRSYLQPLYHTHVWIPLQVGDPFYRSKAVPHTGQRSLAYLGDVRQVEREDT